MDDTATMGTGTQGVDPDCGSGKRNHYFRAKRLKAEEFQAEQDYFVGRRRLINRAVLGWGVVHGFALPRLRPPTPPAKGKAATQLTKTADDGVDLTVGRGVALDRAGREVVLVQDQSLNADNTFLLKPSTGGGWTAGAPGDPALTPGRYVLSAHYAERGVGRVMTGQDCSCGCGKPETNYVCETVVFSLRKLGEERCPCGAPDCPDCEGCFGDCCGDTDRGPHARLCAWVSDAPPEPGGCLPHWNGYAVAVDDPVALACLDLVDPGDRCKPLKVGAIEDACGPRRIVKNNDLLYDLIRGCDLTRIVDFGWKHLHRAPDPVPWEEFRQLFRPKDHPRAHTDFTVTFSAPVKIESLARPEVFAMTVIRRDEDTGWRLQRRVPITALHPDTSRPSPPGMTFGFRVEVDEGWWDDEMAKDGYSWLSAVAFLVEIEVRGDLIEDCSDQLVDANTHGLRVQPTGDGTPGGTLLSCFNVLPKPTSAPRRRGQD